MATKKDKPEAVQSLKLYTWTCGWADGGSLMVLARSAAEARRLARTLAERMRSEPYEGAMLEILEEKPTVHDYPCVVSA